MIKRGSEEFSGYNKPKATPKHPTKSHAVLAKEGDTVKLIRFGQQGVKGAGANPTQWNVISTSQNSVVGGFIGSIPSKGLPLGINTIRIRSYGNDGRHHDCHVRIRIVDADSCAITSAEHVTAWLRDRKTDVVTIRTSRPAACAITSSAVPHVDIASTP
ncbi:hypothetical protein EBT25_16185, partial [bacterium]|nr:hypothetical protein [bacterium]